MDNSGFDSAEQLVIDSINKVWGLFLNLPVTHPEDNREFGYAIHLLQQKLAMRILRREHPSYWGPHSLKEKSDESSLFRP